MQIKAHQWSRTLAQGPLKGIYFFAGEELLVLEALDAVRERAQQEGYSERQVLHADGRFNWNQLAAAGADLSLFAQRRIIDLRLATGRPGRDGSKAIIAWCERPPADVLLLVSANEWSNRHQGAWSKALAKAGDMVVFYPPRAHQWPAFIGERLARAGVRVETDAARILAARVEGNLLAAQQEINKLKAIVGERQRPLTASELERIIADNTRYDVFKLVDAAFAGNIPRTVRILHGLLAEGNDVLALMGWLINQLHVLLRLTTASNFAAQAKAERLWAERSRQLQQVLARAPRAYWETCLVQAGQIERMAKGRASGNPQLALERLLIAIADPRVRRLT